MGELIGKGGEGKTPSQINQQSAASGSSTDAGKSFKHKRAMPEKPMMQQASQESGLESVPPSKLKERAKWRRYYYRSHKKMVQRGEERRQDPAAQKRDRKTRKRYKQREQVRITEYMGEYRQRDDVKRIERVRDKGRRTSEDDRQEKSQYDADYYWMNKKRIKQRAQERRRKGIAKKKEKGWREGLRWMKKLSDPGSDTFTLHGAIVAVGERRVKAARENLRELLNDEHAFNRAEAAAALGKIGDARDVDAIAQRIPIAMSEHDYAYVKEALLALGRIRTKEALSELSRYLEGYNDTIKEYAERGCQLAFFPGFENKPIPAFKDSPLPPGCMKHLKRLGEQRRARKAKEATGQ